MPSDGWMWWPVRLLLFFWFRIDISSSIGAQIQNPKPIIPLPYRHRQPPSATHGRRVTDSDDGERNGFKSCMVEVLVVTWGVTRLSVG